MPLSLSSDDVFKLINKKIVFTVTTGRSGTGFLAEILSFLPRVTCHHEAEPDFVEVFRSSLQQPSLAKEFLCEKKLPQIISDSRPVYVETSHLVCKGFLEPLLELGGKPDLILLSRPHREVALSLYQLDTIPGRTDKALRYYLSPNDPGVLPLPKWESLHDYQLCYWYCLEIERRRAYYKSFFKEAGANVVEISLSDLVRPSSLYALLRDLGLPRFSISFWFKYFMFRKTKVNTKAGRKKSVCSDIDIEALESEVDQLISGCSNL